ncbi:endolytic transglycosylase MltG [Desulfuromonas thiophila]|uniref:endolytic transglycosylase MltG n=1 Tax=Desulfuromonas thiophila TaxID=57664 RepID=UPI00149551F6|nr:endolytic transglycosylase MltG [Desulfuromonas thiophila]
MARKTVSPFDNAVVPGRRGPRRLLLAILTLSLAVTLLATLALWEVHRPVVLTAPCDLTITAGQSLPAIARQLQRAGVIRSAPLFVALARWQGVAGHLQAGSYRFEGGLTAVAVLDRLSRGAVQLVRCTLPEGLTARETIARLAAAGLGSAERFAALLADAEFIRSLELEAPSLEGYLFPETYYFAAGTPEPAILATLVRQLRQQLDEELRQAAADQGLDLHQWLTLASIVQKESGLTEEMPRIAAVFHNRLRLGMPLQADPTVIYGLEGFDGNLTRAHLRTDHPYNTYTRTQLPPGPIANPGLSALRAVARPATEDALYFVARGDGSHQFSRTLQEHNRAVRRYQKRH